MRACAVDAFNVVRGPENPVTRMQVQYSTPRAAKAWQVVARSQTGHNDSLGLCSLHPAQSTLAVVFFGLRAILKVVILSALGSHATLYRL